MGKVYQYKNQVNLTPAELFFWVTVDKTLQQLGVSDLGAVFAILAGQPILPTKGKFRGATKGRHLLPSLLVACSTLT